jgi:hypothetical protein
LKITLTPVRPHTHDVFEGQSFEFSVTALDSHNRVVTGPGSSDYITVNIELIHLALPPIPGTQYFISNWLGPDQDLASGTANFMAEIGGPGRCQITAQDTANPQIPIASVTVNVLPPA